MCHGKGSHYHFIAFDMRRKDGEEYMYKTESRNFEDLRFSKTLVIENQKPHLLDPGLILKTYLKPRFSKTCG